MRPAVAVLAAAGFYVVLAIAITWPLALHPGSVVPNDLGDPLLNTWLMAWNARVPPLTAAWWNTPQFFPLDGTMAFSEHLLGLSVITTPVILVSGNPLLAYNAVFFLSFVLSALSAYFLTYTISRRHDCAFVAGLAFGFAPYRMAQLAHVQVLSAYWMPLTLAALHLYFQDRPRALARVVRRILGHAGIGVRLLPVLLVGARHSLAAVVRGRPRAAGRSGACGVRVGGGGSRDGPAHVRLLEVPARVRIAARAGRNHGVQRGRREPAESARQPPALGLARRRRPSRVDALPRDHAGHPHDSGTGDRVGHDCRATCPEMARTPRPVGSGAGLPERGRVGVVLRSVEDTDWRACSCCRSACLTSRSPWRCCSSSRRRRSTRRCERHGSGVPLSRSTRWRRR